MNMYTNILEEMESYAEAYHVPIIDSSSRDLLVAEVRKRQPRTVLEIGTAIGYSTLLLAANIPPDGLITTIELDQERYDKACEYLSQAGVLERIRMYKGDAAKVLPELLGPFEFVFIDAAKGQYLDYLHKIMDKLAPDAVIVADNVLFRGYVEQNNPPRRYKTLVRRLQQYLAFVQTDARFETTIHRLGDGLAISHYQGVNNQ